MARKQQTSSWLAFNVRRLLSHVLENMMSTYRSFFNQIPWSHDDPRLCERPSASGFLEPDVNAKTQKTLLCRKRREKLCFVTHAELLVDIRAPHKKEGGKAKYKLQKVCLLGPTEIGNRVLLLLPRELLEGCSEPRQPQKQTPADSVRCC
jgi:hypothetical protein